LGRALRTYGDSSVLLGDGVGAAMGRDASIASVDVDLRTCTVESLQYSTALTDVASTTLDVLLSTSDGDGNGDMLGRRRGASRATRR
jgi:hypothetical protein